MDNLTAKLAAFACEVEFDTLPAEVVREMKHIVLDSFGCAINGFSTERGRIAVEFARILGGPPESTIVGTNTKVSSANAAFANGELINALDFDAFSAGHSAPTIIPTVLALSEAAGVPGKDALLAVAVGLEIAARLKTKGGIVISREMGKEEIKCRSVYGHSVVTVAAAAAGGKVLNLGREQMANAIGVAACICPPNIQSKWMNTAPVRMTKYGSPGWGSHAAIGAVLLAQMGYIGDTDVFDGDYGFWRYTGDEEWKTEEKVRDLNIEWKCQRNTYKQYPGGL